MSRCLYAQEEALFLNPDLLGGKAANLAWLSREGLPVPRWWVVTTDIFTQLLRDNGLSEMVARELAGIGPDTEPAAIEPIAPASRPKCCAPASPASCCRPSASW